MTLPTITREELRHLIAGDDGLGGLFTGVAQDDGVTTVQAQDTLVDASTHGLKDGAWSDERFANGYIYLPESEEENRILGYSPDTGAITVSRLFANTPTSGITAYELHTHGLSVAQLHTAIGRACRDARIEDHVVLSGLIQDGDLLEDGVSLWFPEAGTVTKQVETWGEVSLAVPGAAGYVETKDFRVHAGRAYVFGATVRAISADAALAVYTLGGTEIEASYVNGVSSTGLADGTDWVDIRGTFVAPDSPTSVQLRLEGANSRWRGVYCYDATARVPLPAWLHAPRDQIAGLYYRLGSELVFLPATAPRGRFLEVWPSTLPGPVVVHVARPIAAPEDDDDTIPEAARDLVFYGALRFCYRRLALPAAVHKSEFAEAFHFADDAWISALANADPVNKYGRMPWGR